MGFYRLAGDHDRDIHLLSYNIHCLGTYFIVFRYQAYCKKDTETEDCLAELYKSKIVSQELTNH